MKQTGRFRVIVPVTEDNLMPELMIICGACGVFVTGVAILVAVALGMLVWLAGTDWARRPSKGAGLQPSGRR